MTLECVALLAHLNRRRASVSGETDLCSDAQEFDVDSVSHVMTRVCEERWTPSEQLSSSSSMSTVRSVSSGHADSVETGSLAGTSSPRLYSRQTTSCLVMRPDELAQGDVAEQQLTLTPLTEELSAQNSEDLKVETITPECVEERLHSRQQPSLISGNIGQPIDYYAPVL